MMWDVTFCNQTINRRLGFHPAFSSLLKFIITQRFEFSTDYEEEGLHEKVKKRNGRNCFYICSRIDAKLSGKGRNNYRLKWKQS